MENNFNQPGNFGQNPMEFNNTQQFKQNLPNATAVLIMGILSLVACVCYGLGFIFGIIGLILANKDEKLYKANPQRYMGYSNLRTGKILSIVGIILSIIYIVYLIYAIVALGGISGITEIIEQAQEAQRAGGAY